MNRLEVVDLLFFFSLFFSVLIVSSSKIAANSPCFISVVHCTNFHSFFPSFSSVNYFFFFSVTKRSILLDGFFACNFIPQQEANKYNSYRQSAHSFPPNSSPPHTTTPLHFAFPSLSTSIRSILLLLLSLFIFFFLIYKICREHVERVDLIKKKKKKWLTKQSYFKRKKIKKTKINKLK